MVLATIGWIPLFHLTPREAQRNIIDDKLELVINEGRSIRILVEGVW